MSAASTEAQPSLRLPPRKRLRAEVIIVLGMTLGQSAVYAAMRLLERYLAEPAIGQQSTTLNPSRNDIDYVDLVYQILGIGFRLFPVALALYLLSSHGIGWRQRLGLTALRRHWGRDLVTGLGLAAAIGLPGLGLYAAGRALGQTVRINTSGLPDVWWSATILLASAAVIGLLEEALVVGYLVTRMKDMQVSLPWIIAASALLRGGYHLYQGWPMALGNVVMGVVFAWVYHRTGRLGPLILAHWTLDAVAFIGPEFVPQSFLDALNGD